MTGTRNNIYGNIVAITFDPAHVPEALTSRFLNVTRDGTTTTLSKPALGFVDQSGYGWHSYHDYVYTGITSDDMILSIDCLREKGQDFIRFTITNPDFSAKNGVSIKISIDEYVLTDITAKNEASTYHFLAERLQADGFLKSDRNFYLRLQRALYNAFTPIFTAKAIELESSGQATARLGQETQSAAPEILLH